MKGVLEKKKEQILCLNEYVKRVESKLNEVKDFSANFDGPRFGFFGLVQCCLAS